MRLDLVQNLKTAPTYLFIRIMLKNCRPFVSYIIYVFVQLYRYFHGYMVFMSTSKYLCRGFYSDQALRKLGIIANEIL